MSAAFVHHGATARSRELENPVTDDSPPIEVADLLRPQGTGPLWGMASSDLNATLLAWPPRHAIEEHINPERDVLLLVLEGDGVVWIDGVEHHLARGQALLISKGRSRAIEAGAAGIRYLSVHIRRHGMQIEGLADVGE